ncbi:MAG: 50S ribosomal protein L24 [Candidatus Krumholzibacteriota bacterium]|nr:50S ribosomal protein L24 [Candidatus Krumholzibacteriota bacterium]
MRIKKNDTVRVIAGNSKGMEGKVLKVYPENNRVIVEKVKLIKRHTRQTSQDNTGGIVEKEAPINVSNVILVCPKCSKPAKTEIASLADGRKIRKCKRCNETLGDDD